MDNRKQRELKFRAWDGNQMLYEGWNNDFFVTKEIVFRFDRVMQFTGLTDKNGKEIYEGDVVSYHFATEFNRQVRPEKQVVYNASTVSYYVGERQLTDSSHKDIDVIGNIYETPDLLTPQPNP